MADYVKTKWEDNKTPVNAKNLNNIEDGIKKNEQDIDAVEEDVAIAKSAADQAQKEVDAAEERIDSAERDIEAIEKNVSTAQQTANQAQREVDDLEKDMDDAEVELKKLKEAVAAMGTFFGRIVSESGAQVTKTVTPNAFEMYVNESRKMSLKIYLENDTTTPSKTLESDMFWIITGSFGNDIQEPYTQKTLIFYTETGSLGITTGLKKWIACSKHESLPNFRIEIVCPPNTYCARITNNNEA